VRQRSFAPSPLASAQNARTRNERFQSSPQQREGTYHPQTDRPVVSTIRLTFPTPIRRTSTFRLTCAQASAGGDVHHSLGSPHGIRGEMYSSRSLFPHHAVNRETLSLHVRPLSGDLSFVHETTRRAHSRRVSSRYVKQIIAVDGKSLMSSANHADAKHRMRAQ
jgi:hypothetical protein